MLEEVIDTIAHGKELPEKYQNHPLKGTFKGCYDCHILPDWILIYKIDKDKLILLLLDIGTHADIFK